VRRSGRLAGWGGVVRICEEGDEDEGECEEKDDSERSIAESCGERGVGSWSGSVSVPAAVCCVRRSSGTVVVVGIVAVSERLLLVCDVGVGWRVDENATRRVCLPSHRLLVCFHTLCERPHHTRHRNETAHAGEAEGEAESTLHVVWVWSLE